MKLSRGGKALLWSALAVFWYIFWVFADIGVMTLLKMASPVVLGYWGGLGILFGGILAIACLGIVYWRQTWPWMLAATGLMGQALAWFTWSMAMTALQAVTDPAMVNLLQQTPLFK